VPPFHHFKISSETVFISFLQSLNPVIGLLEVCFHTPIVSRALLHQILANLNVQQLRDHVALDPANKRSLPRHVVNVFVIDEKTIKVVVERHGGVKSISEALLSAPVDWQRLERVGVDPGPDPKILVLNELLLDPGQAELGVTIIILVPVPSHHVQDVEDAVTLTVDAVKDGVLVPGPALVPVASRQVAGETFHLLPTLAEDLG